MSTAGHSLPIIPSLPPLEMSTGVACTPSSPADDNDSPATRTNPSSRQSFMTALTSSRQGTPARLDGSELRASSPSALPAPLGLRKSLSVDSFVQYGREATSSTGTRANRVYTGPSFAPSQDLVFEVSARLKQGNDVPDPALQVPGTSSGEEYDQSLVSDSDIERSDPLNQLGERGRRVSAKSQEKNRLSIRGGELPLPSRTPTLSMTSSTSSFSGTSSSSREHAPSLQTASSMQSMARRGASIFAGVPTGRTRSGSLGVYVTHSGKPMLINTRVSTVSPS
jgi:hypothetical protein